MTETNRAAQLANRVARLDAAITELQARRARASAELADLHAGARLVPAPQPRAVDDPDLLDAALQNLRDRGAASGSALARRLQRRAGDVLAVCRALHDRGQITRTGNTWTLANATAGTRDSTTAATSSRRNGDVTNPTDGRRAETPGTQHALRNTQRQDVRHPGPGDNERDTAQNSARPGVCAREQVESAS